MNDLVKAIEPPEKWGWEMKTRSDVDIFLQKLDVNKPHEIRFISWLVSLDIIKLGKISLSQQIRDLVSEYESLIAEYFESNPENPLKCLSKKEGHIIKIDIKRSITWMQKLVEDLKLETDLYKDGKFHSHRILATLTRKDDFYEYLQGFDRYVLISYILAIEFTSKLKLPSSVAEALAYHVAHDLIRLVDISKFTKDSDWAAAHFQKLDEKIKIVSPTNWVLLEKMGVGSIHFAMKWQALTFADDHPVNDTLLIWDYVIYHRKRYMDYIERLCLAHVVQVKPKDEFVIDQLQHFKNYDVVQIINYAEMRNEPMLSQKQILLILSIAVLILSIKYFNYKN